MTKGIIALTAEQIEECHDVMDNKLDIPDPYYELIYDILSEVVEAAHNSLYVAVVKIGSIEIIEEEIVSDNVIFGWDFRNRVRLRC